MSTLNEINELIDSMHTLLPEEKCKDETIICECFLVNASDIRSLTESEMGISEVMTKLSMGTGCGSCLKNKMTWIKTI